MMVILAVALGAAGFLIGYGVGTNVCFQKMIDTLNDFNNILEEVVIHGKDLHAQHDGR